METSIAKDSANSLEGILNEIERVLYGSDAFLSYNNREINTPEQPSRFSLAVAFAELLADAPRYITSRHLGLLLKEFQSWEVLEICKFVLQKEGKDSFLPQVAQKLQLAARRLHEVALV